MSTLLFDLFKFAKLVDFKNGEILLMSTHVNIMPTDFLCEQQKMMIESQGLEKAYKNIYGSAKKGSLKYNQEFVKRQHFSDKRKIIDWQTKIVAFSGWGEVEMALTEIGSSRYIVHFKNSPYPNAYGKANYPVDFIATGFVAGGLSVTAETDLDAIETKCTSKGDAFCELLVDTPEVIEKTRLELWKKWSLI